MKSLLISISLFLLISSSAAAKYGINFDTLSCYRADISTFTSVFFKEDLKEKFHSVKVINPKTKENLKFHYLDSLNNTQSGLWLFLFAGIGSSSKSIHSKKLSFFIRQSGYKGNILLIPSVFRADFVKSFSTNGIVGNIPKDAQDLGAAIELVIKSLKNKENKRFSKIHYLGFSLGALTAAHLAAHNKNLNKANAPAKVFLMNSPVDLFKSLSGLDRMSSHPVSVFETAGLSSSFVSGQLKESIQEKAEEVFCKLKEYSPQKIESFVATNLVSMAGNVFYQGQRRTSTGFFEDRLGELPDSADRNEKRRYWRQAKILASKLSFLEYVQYAVIPSINSNQENSTVEQINARVSMRGLESTFRKFQKDFYLIHSTDDFLLSSYSEFSKYRDYFLQENSFVVDRGGHLGLLQNTNAISFIEENL